MVHLLLVSVRRRRTEAGLLKVLGLVRNQVAAVVSWQATAVALVGIVAGVPLGIAAGKIARRVFATNWSPRMSWPSFRPGWPRSRPVQLLKAE
jgi:ABC-type antimicrobial peptide transport system permease subunit